MTPAAAWDPPPTISGTSIDGRATRWGWALRTTDGGDTSSSSWLSVRTLAGKVLEVKGAAPRTPCATCRRSSSNSTGSASAPVRAFSSSSSSSSVSDGAAGAAPAPSPLVQSTRRQFASPTLAAASPVSDQPGNDTGGDDDDDDEGGAGGKLMNNTLYCGNLPLRDGSLRLKELTRLPAPPHKAVLSVKTAAYENLTRQVGVVDGVVERFLQRHYNALSSSVHAVGRVSTQFDALTDRVAKLREQVRGTKDLLTSGMQEQSIQELWERKLEHMAFLEMLDALESLSHCPRRIDSLVRRRRFAAPPWRTSTRARSSCTPRTCSCARPGASCVTRFWRGRAGFSTPSCCTSRSSSSSPPLTIPNSSSSSSSSSHIRRCSRCLEATRTSRHWRRSRAWPTTPPAVVVDKKEVLRGQLSLRSSRTLFRRPFRGRSWCPRTRGGGAESEVVAVRSPMAVALSAAAAAAAATIAAASSSFPQKQQESPAGSSSSPQPQPSYDQLTSCRWRKCTTCEDWMEAEGQARESGRDGPDRSKERGSRAIGQGWNFLLGVWKRLLVLLVLLVLLLIRNNAVRLVLVLFVSVVGGAARDKRCHS